jgi:chaperone BCS1
MHSNLSFSGFLNAIDGVRSQEGQILFMTTNHKERLDPALLRPGRADVHVHLNYASENQIKNLF